MRLFKKLNAYCFCLFSLLLSTASASPLVGQPLSVALNLSTDWKAYNIPLPTGEWRVAAVVNEGAQENSMNGSLFGRHIDGVYEHISLVQMQGSTVKALVLVTAKVKTSVETQEPDICADTSNFAYVNTFGARNIVTKCLSVSSLQPQRKANAQLLDETAKWLTANGLSLPSNMVGFQYAQLANPRRYLSFGYYVNAATWGFNSATSLNGVPAWSDAAVRTNPTKSRFITSLTSFGQQYSTSIKAAAEGRAAVSAATLRAFAFDNISAVNSMPTGVSRAERRLAEIRSTCRSIGFKDKTSGMKNCVKELLTR